jgi:hypothetical protein
MANYANETYYVIVLRIVSRKAVRVTHGVGATTFASSIARRVHRAS